MLVRGAAAAQRDWAVLGKDSTGFVSAAWCLFCQARPWQDTLESSSFQSLCPAAHTGSSSPRQVPPQCSFGPTLPLNVPIDQPGAMGEKQIPTAANQPRAAVGDMTALIREGERKTEILANYPQPPSVPVMRIVSLTSPSSLFSLPHSPGPSPPGRRTGLVVEEVTISTCCPTLFWPRVAAHHPTLVFLPMSGFSQTCRHGDPDLLKSLQSLH